MKVKKNGIIDKIIFIFFYESMKIFHKFDLRKIGMKWSLINEKNQKKYE